MGFVYLYVCQGNESSDALLDDLLRHQVLGDLGTAFTLATKIDVLPMVIYTEFTLSANIAMASALSVVLGLVTWALLLIARSFSGTTVAAGG